MDTDDTEPVPVAGRFPRLPFVAEKLISVHAPSDYFVRRFFLGMRGPA